MIDTHAHIDDPLYTADLPAFIAAQKEGGVEAILVPGVNADSIEPVWSVCQQFPGYLFPAIGLHPEEVKEDFSAVLDHMESVLAERQRGDGMHYIAIGEIGLDYHFDTTYKAQQQAAFRRQLRWAIDYDLPVMIHSRDATEDMLTILKEFCLSPFTSHLSPRLKGVMHCFSGSLEVAKQYLDLGLYLGIGGVLTFKNAKLPDTLKELNELSIINHQLSIVNRLVLETDAPYMAPVPFRGQTNESRFIRYVIDRLEQVFQRPYKEIEQATTRNAKELFRLNM